MTAGATAIRRGESGCCGVGRSRKGGVEEAGLGCSAGGAVLCGVSGSSQLLVASELIVTGLQDTLPSWAQKRPPRRPVCRVLCLYLLPRMAAMASGGLHRRRRRVIESVFGGREPWVRHGDVSVSWNLALPRADGSTPLSSARTLPRRWWEECV